jgi:hypothetical protein
MRTMMIEPDGWECTLADCRPGYFTFRCNPDDEPELCIKTEYKINGQMEVFCSSGETFWGYTGTDDDRKALVVQPVKVVWTDA